MASVCLLNDSVYFPLEAQSTDSPQWATHRITFRVTQRYNSWGLSHSHSSHASAGSHTVGSPLLCWGYKWLPLAPFQLSFNSQPTFHDWSPLLNPVLSLSLLLVQLDGLRYITGETGSAGRQKEESDFHDTFWFRSSPDMPLSHKCVCPVYSFLLLAEQLDPYYGSCEYWVIKCK